MSGRKIIDGLQEAIAFERGSGCALCDVGIASDRRDGGWRHYGPPGHWAEKIGAKCTRFAAPLRLVSDSG